MPPPELGIYVIDMEFQRADGFSFCVAHLVFSFALDKISYFVTLKYKLVTLLTIFKAKCVVHDFF